MSDLTTELRDRGVAGLPCPYDLETLKRWNELLDAEFAKADDTNRNYVRIDQLFELGIFNEIFNDRLREVFLSIMPDPVLLCCHVYETLPSDKPHVFGDSFNGWHRDVNVLPGLETNAPNFVTLFVNLSEVTEQSGAFEVAPGSFTGLGVDGMESIKLVGEVGTTCVWNRTLLHRASPNQSNSNRRILKISIQHNYLQNKHIFSDGFVKVLEGVRKQEDELLTYMLGGKHAVSPRAPSIHNAATMSVKDYLPMNSNSKIALGLVTLLRGINIYVRRGKLLFGP